MKMLIMVVLYALAGFGVYVLVKAADREIGALDVKEYVLLGAIWPATVFVIAVSTIVAFITLMWEE